MHHLAAITSSLVSLGLVLAIYYCNILSHPNSWLRSGTLGMVLLALLTVFFPLAVAASVIGLWNALTSGISGGAVVAIGIDLASVGVVIATVLTFRSLVRATYRRIAGTGTITPLSPRPVASRSGVAPKRKAA